MSGISTGVGLISGIDTASLINQILSIEARPKTYAQARVFGLQMQQTAYLDLNTRLNALKSAATKFRTSKSLQTKLATSSDAAVLTGPCGLCGARAMRCASASAAIRRASLRPPQCVMSG